MFPWNQGRPTLPKDEVLGFVPMEWDEIAEWCDNNGIAAGDRDLMLYQANRIRKSFGCPLFVVRKSANT